MSKKKNLVIKSKSQSPLKIFEAADSTPAVKKYVFQGVFTACSTNDHVVVNRNNRIYGENEVLRHLSYLRENIQTNGFILGELDHPIDRFDTQMKEASHMITDLWYDQPSHCVMGKLEVLDTPNGQIARTLIDAGYPLFVSSRAAGEVDPKTKEVHIEQIFTYDIVCTPGFAEARLSKVDESLSRKATNYLNESAVTLKSEANSTRKFGILDESVSIIESDLEVPQMDEWKKSLMENSDIEKLSKPLLEEDEEFKLPETDLNPNTANEADDDEKEEEKKQKEDDKKEDDDKETALTDEEKAEKRSLIIGIEAFAADGENETEDSKREEIIDIETVPAEDEEGEKKSEDKDKKEKKSGENEDDEKKADECDASEKDADPLTTKTKDAGKDVAATKKVLNDCDKSEDIKKQTKNDMDKYKELLSKAKKLADVKESIVRLYPFSVSLSDHNFAKFAALQPADKNKVNKFIIEHAIFDVDDINDKWTTPLINEKRSLKNWLRLAPEEYRQLYVEAPQDVQDAIEESAKFVEIRTQADADRFWARTNLKKYDDTMLRKSLNEQYMIVESATPTETSETARALGYSMDYFKMIEDLAE